MTRPPPSSTLFPYTTLFRSDHSELRSEERSQTQLPDRAQDSARRHGLSRLGRDEVRIPERHVQKRRCWGSELGTEGGARRNRERLQEPDANDEAWGQDFTANQEGEALGAGVPS